MEDIQADIEESSAFIKVKNPMDIIIENPLPSSKCASVIHIAGDQSSSITLSGIRKNKFNELYTISGGASANQVSVGGLFE